MLIKGFPKDKPRQWGPNEAVRSAVLDYYENTLGIGAPVLFLPFWENSGDVGYDIANGTQYTFGSGVSWDSQAIKTNGLSSGVIDLGSSFVVGTGEYYISCRFFGPSTAYPIDSFALSSRSSSTTTGYEFLLGSGSISGTAKLRWKDSQEQYDLITATELNDNKFHTLSGNFISGYGQFYCDGAFVSQAIRSWSLTNTQNTFIAKRGTTYFSGIIDQVLFFNKSLSDGQISLLHDTPYAAIQPRSFPTYFFPSAGSGGTTDLIISSVSQGQTLENVALVQQNVLAIGNIAQSQSLGAIDLVQANILQIAGNAQSQTLSNLDLVQANVLSVSSIAQGQDLESLDLVQQNTLAIGNISQGQTIENVELSTALILAIADLVQAQSLENVALVQANILSIGNTSQGQALENVNIVQQNTLSIQGISQAQSVQSVILSTDVILAIADLIQSQGVGAIDLVQANVLGINNIAQGQTASTVSLVQAHVLAINNLLSAQGIDNVRLVMPSGLSGIVTVQFSMAVPGVAFSMKIPRSTITIN